MGLVQAPHLLPGPLLSDLSFEGSCPPVLFAYHQVNHLSLSWSLPIHFVLEPLTSYPPMATPASHLLPISGCSAESGPFSHFRREWPCQVALLMTPFSKEESEAQRVSVTCPGRLSGSVRETQPPEPVSFPPQAAVLDQALLSPSTLGLHQLFPSSPMSPSVLFSLPWKPGSLQFMPLSSSLSSWVSALSGPWRLSSFPPLSLGPGSVRGPTFHPHCMAR